jgi:conjugative relaxase-like TrwC/TraI family protein
MTGGPGAGLYLWRAQGCSEAEREPDAAERAAAAGKGAEYYQAAVRAGEARAVLAGGGLAALGLKPGEVTDKETVLRLLRCQHPETGEQLGSRMPVYKTRDERIAEAVSKAGPVSEEEAARIAEAIGTSITDQNARAFFDVTYSAPKTVSTYYAAAREAARRATERGDLDNAEHYGRIADAVLGAHNQAVEEASAFLEEQTWVRSGRHTRTGEATTGRFEKPTGVVRISFQHTTSRTTDPHLHTHTGFVNRAQCADGKWRALHSAGWKVVKGAVAEMYERRLEQLVVERTPARFEWTPGAMAREIHGIDPQVLEESSQRTSQVVGAEKGLVDDFVQQYGRQPTPVEQRKIHRDAGLQSRDRKSHASPGEQLEAWGARLSQTPETVVDGANRSGAEADFWAAPAQTPTGVEAAVRQSLVTVQSRQAVWDAGILAAELTLHLPADQRDRAFELAREVTGEGNRFGVVSVSRREPRGVPTEFIDSSRGAPVWRDPILNKFALGDHMRAEARLAADARAHTVTPWTEQERQQLREQWSAAGDTISSEQAAAALAVLGSAHAGDVLVAPAGTGKSYTAGKIAAAWQSKGGTVLGTATSQIASHVLTEHGLPAMNATVLLQRYERENGQRLEPGTLLVFDEANMTSTDQLRRVQAVATRDGAKVLYFGDPYQLEAVGAGGGLALMAEKNGAVAELNEVRRFAAEWEKQASLQLRVGDTAGLDEYMRHGRIHGGGEHAMRVAAVDRYVADVLSGKTSALITGTNGDAAHLNGLVQARLAQLNHNGMGTGEVIGETMENNPVLIGSRIQWRENVYRVDADNGQPVVNREFLTVVGPIAGDQVLLRREGDGSAVRVPQDWLSSKAALGYAGTEHAYEGVTVATAHTLVPGYVAMTRGVERNEAWLTTSEAGDEHGPALDVSARARFADALSPAGREKAALQHLRDELDTGKGTAVLSAVWEQVERVAMRDAAMDIVGAVLGWDTADAITAGEGGRQVVTELTRAELAGHDREALLREATDGWTPAGARDLDAVLAGRVRQRMRDRAAERQATTWQERVAGVREHGEAGQFLGEIARRWDKRIAQLGERAAATPPQWAVDQLGPVPEQEQQRAEWEQRAGRIAAYREQAGISDALPSVGPAPHTRDVVELTAWRDAARAGGRPVDEFDYRAQPDSELEAKRARWAWLAESAPAYVEPELARAYDEQRRAEADAVLMRQMAAQAGSDAERDSLVEGARLQTEQAALATERARVLQEAHDQRQAWLDQHEGDRDAAVEAERELAQRGRELGNQVEPEQAALFEVETELTAPDDEADREIAAAADRERQPQAEAQQGVDEEAVALRAAHERRLARDQAMLRRSAELRAQLGPQAGDEELRRTLYEQRRAEEQAFAARQVATLADEDKRQQLLADADRREAHAQAMAERARELLEQAERAVAEQAVEKEQAAAEQAERGDDRTPGDERQQGLFDTPETTVDQRVRMQRLHESATEEQASDRAPSEAVVVRQMIGRERDNAASLADVEVQTRYAKEMLERRAAEKDAAREAEQAARAEAEAEAQQARERAAEQAAEKAAGQELGL